MAMNVVLAALSAAFAVVTVEGHYCCTPRQYEGYQGIYSGISSKKYELLERGLVKLSIDADQQKIAGSGYIKRNGVSQHFRYIRDFKTQIRYYITNGTCSKKQMERPFTRCVPDDVMKTGTFTFGMDANSIKAKYFNIKVPVCQGHVLYIVTMAPVASKTDEKLCAPISETSFGYYNGNDGPVKFLNNIGYTNITAGIEDEDVFKLPPECTTRPEWDYWLVDDDRLETEALLGI